MVVTHTAFAMASTQQRYAMEMQQRYMQRLERQEDLRLDTVRVDNDSGKRERRRTNKKREEETANLTMDRHVNAKYRIYNIIIDSDHRDKDSYPDSSDFVVKLQNNLTNITAIRILKTEFYQPSNSFGYFVLNEMRVPLQLYNVEHAYLYLNGYINTVVANDTNVPLFGRIGPGTDIYPAISSDPFKDPYIYVMRPVEPKMRRFHVKLLRADGSVYPVNSARVVLTAAVYCLVT